MSIILSLVKNFHTPSVPNTKILICSSSKSYSFTSGIEITPKESLSKSPKLLVIDKPGYFLFLYQIRRGPTVNLLITPPCSSILFFSSVLFRVWRVFNSFIVFVWDIKIIFESPKFEVIILLQFFELNKNTINDVEPDKWQKFDFEYFVWSSSSNFL